MSVVTVPRQPFGVLDSPRLAHLSSGKNRQNGVGRRSSPLSGKAKMAVPAVSLKRRFSTSVYDDGRNDDIDDDAENVNPDMFLSSAKRSKTESSIKSKPSSFEAPSSFNFTFSAPKSSASSSMPPPATRSAKLRTPMRPSPPRKSSPRAPLTAPAGRSPKQKRDRRRLSAHTKVTRLDPPAFSRSLNRTALPFSLDAALNSTLAPSPAPSVQADPITIDEAMPQSWFFSIYEDTPDEEAENLMEHSTLTLDLGSDDENPSKDIGHCGKENVAPADYTSSPSNSSRRSPQQSKPSTDVDADAAPRSPLGHLDTEDFFPEGVTKDSVVIVLDSPPENFSLAPVALPEDKSGPVPATISQDADLAAVDVVPLPQQSAFDGEILIWEDSTRSTPTSAGGKRKRGICSEDE